MSFSIHSLIVTNAFSYLVEHKVIDVWYRWVVHARLSAGFGHDRGYDFSISVICMGSLRSTCPTLVRSTELRENCVQAIAFPPAGFLCQKHASHRYRIALIKPCIRALSVADKVSVRIDIRGFLSLQFLVKNEDGQISFVEFYCCPDEETESET